MNYIKENADGTFTLEHTGDRYRVASEADREAFERGDLKGKTLTAYKAEDFQPFLLIKID